MIVLSCRVWVCSALPFHLSHHRRQSFNTRSVGRTDDHTPPDQTLKSICPLQRKKHPQMTAPRNEMISVRMGARPVC